MTYLRFADLNPEACVGLRVKYTLLAMYLLGQNIFSFVSAINIPWALHMNSEGYIIK